MSLTRRLSALFLATLGLVLVGFSATLYVGARVYLHRQLDERLASALAILAAAAEIHPDDVEWEPQERVLPPDQGPGPDRLRWMVFDDRGRLIDRSRNADVEELSPAWTPRAGVADGPRDLRDRLGRIWRVSRLDVLPSSGQHPGSRVASARRGRSEPGGAGRPGSDADERLFPALFLTACVPLEPVEATLAALAWTLVALSGGAWGLAALLGRRLSRRALAPLSRMVDSARGLDAADPGWSLGLAGTGDELDDLGRAFNELLGRLHLAYERQRRFGGDASHQLRTPLTVLIGQIEVALRQERPAEEYRRVLRAALGRAVHLSRIVEALLFLSRAEGEALLPDLEVVDLGRWVADHVAGRPPGAEVVHHPSEGDGLPVRAHPPLLGQLLDNLLDNAAKYGGPEATVVVRTRRQGESALLAVEDTGPGIPPDDLPRVFEPFYRSACARRRGLPGVGLGLAVVRRIALALGGSVEIRNGVGGGCCIEVRLPIAASASDSTSEAGIAGSTR